MSLDVAYTYCINLTEEEKVEIDKQVRKNKFELKFAIFFPFLPFPTVPMPYAPFIPVEGFSLQQIVRNAKDRAESAVAEKMAPLAQAADEYQEAYNEDKETKEAIKLVEDVNKKWEKSSAKEKYESIRKSKTDVDAIARNTGYKSKNIQKCKNHLFYDIYRLDRYESLGEPVEIKRFDANENQARAWERLENGIHIKEDLTWLKHEKAEQWYEQKNDVAYSESHEKAESHWSGTPWTNTEDEK